MTQKTLFGRRRPDVWSILKKETLALLLAIGTIAQPTVAEDFSNGTFLGPEILNEYGDTIDTRDYSSIIIVNLTKQKLTFFKDGKLVLSTKISSGRVGHETPNGFFRVIGKEANHRSNLYPVKSDGTKGGAPMPYMLKITNDGVAIHGGRVPNYPNSHGCIRVPISKAWKLFRSVPEGTPVAIIGYPKYTDRINRERERILEAMAFDESKYTSSKKKKEGTRKKPTSYDRFEVDEIDRDLVYLDTL